jgi:hypothetical protein
MAKVYKSKIGIQHHSPSSSGLNQSFQSSSLQFSFAKEELLNGEMFYTNIYPLFKCRDYFMEICISSHLDINTPTVYGFRTTDKRVDPSRPILLLHMDPESIISFKRNLLALTHFEKLGGFKSTRILFNKDYPGWLVLKIDPDLFKSPLIMSMYSFILRQMTFSWSINSINGAITGLNTRHSCDKEILNSLRNIDINLFIKSLKKITKEHPLSGILDNELDYLKVCQYDAELISSSLVSLNSLHNYHGIFSFANCIKDNNYSNCGQVGKSWLDSFREIIYKENKRKAKVATINVLSFSITTI